MDEVEGEVVGQRREVRLHRGGESTAPLRGQRE